MEHQSPYLLVNKLANGSFTEVKTGSVLEFSQNPITLHEFYLVNNLNFEKL